MWLFLTENRGILIVLILFTLAKVPSLAVPFWWDEAGAYIPPAVAVAQSGLWTAMPGLHSKGFLEGHPPVLYIVHGALYKVFGRSIWPHRVVQLGFALLGLWFTYWLGRLLWSHSVGVSAAILLATTPMYFAQSSMVLGDLPIAALGVASVYYLCTEWFWKYIVVATLLLQTKETALAVSVAAALYQWFKGRVAPRLSRAVLMHAVPITSLVLFFAIEYLATGSFVQASYFNNNPVLIIDLTRPIESIPAALDQARWVAGVLFFAEGRFVLTTLMVLGILYWRKVWRPEILLFAAITLLYWGAFAIIGFLPRYIMPVLPYLCLMAAASAHVLPLRRIAFRGLIALTVLVHLQFFYATSASGNFETNMQHEQAVAVCEDVARYLQTVKSPINVAADWPILNYLRFPELGYVERRLRVVNTSAIHARSLPDLAVYFSLAPSPESEMLRQRTTRPPVRRFEKGEIFAEIYDLRASGAR